MSKWIFPSGWAGIVSPLLYQLPDVLWHPCQQLLHLRLNNILPQQHLLYNLPLLLRKRHLSQQIVCQLSLQLSELPQLNHSLLGMCITLLHLHLQLLLGPLYNSMPGWVLPDRADLLPLLVTLLQLQCLAHLPLLHLPLLSQQLFLLSMPCHLPQLHWFHRP